MLLAPLPARPRVVVTGAGSGLGRAFCLSLAKQKARIVAADIDLKSAKETARLVEASGGQAHAIRCDVAKAPQVERVAATADKLWKGTDLLINNAGVAAGGHVGEIPLKDWAWMLQINLWGVIHGCHAFVPRMKKRKRGWIINVASTAGIASLPEMAPYNVSKAGVISLTETLTSELAPYDIKVTALCPTYFATNLMDRFRSTSARQRHISQAFFSRSSFTAEQVAEAGLTAVQSGQLISIPQPDGQQVWAVKRASYERYFEKIREQVLTGVFDKLAAEGKRVTSPKS